MGSDQLLADAVSLMVLGMGTVFVFLTLLVFCTTLMSRVIARIVPPAVAPAATLPQAPADASLTAVIAAAIHAHRSRR